MDPVTMSEFPNGLRRARSTGGFSPRLSSRTLTGASLDRAPASAPCVSPPAPVSPIEPLLQTPYVTLRWNATHSFARFVRSERPFATIVDIESEGLKVERALEKAGNIRLLVDLRAVTPRNDPGFEAAIAKFRRKLFGGCQRIVILVRTAVGALQVKRHMREDGFPGEVFTDEGAAIVFLERRSSVCASRSSTGPASRPAGERRAVRMD